MDNTEKPDEGIVAQLQLVPGSTYIPYHLNEGIALRLNQAAAMAREEGYSHLLTMDQDSSFDAGVFDRYVSKATKYLDEHVDNVGVFAVNFQPQFCKADEQPQEVLSTITSGSIISLAFHKAINGYNTALFLDLVDADFCYRINLAGYKTILFSDIILNHAIGYHVPGRSLKNFKVTPRRIHPPVRIYYLVRNSLFMLNKQQLPDGAKKEIHKALGLLKNNLLYNKRFQVIRHIVKAYVDYRKGKMGKIQ
ncbi:MAG: hypothetical protein QM687_07655 [Ferruginibacter sp.]